jgi:glycosyltransferase involved in cell wall biosynthesis
MKLSIVMPAYNEEARIQPTLEAYTAHFGARYGDEFELIIVVNGSRDRTEKIARAVAEKRSQVKVLVEPRAIGKGGAIILGFSMASGDLVGFVDADNATLPAAFNDLVERIGDAGAIIASRHLSGSKVSPSQPWSRRVASRFFNALVRLLFGLPISDTQCGAKLLRGDAMRATLPHLGLTRWAFDVDLLFQLQRLGYRIVETPTTWREPGGSRLRIIHTSLEMFMAICRLRMLYSPLRWVVTIYDVTLGRFIRLKEST